ncbi:ATP-dependent nuclease [Tepidibacter thalassicus]|uniref:Predicted ATP-dependent endonuclease of the OLD family, contains P-loop ATPase and TOPRIM domains n=1 Tax=Tepidibacter thalassicus DSM 15285 TaxID=1123350 RepID=A0A1M5QH69_9FIRM|nr:AAA family ATPase [Tepidibacter thalassicus]SHH13268.1 Predicted ATP-dependent endonuclease of the OLD family, contains P-loop ATPase and TOPRIM domains [Tepidibacter thalassicus DSM 15285]
MYIYKIKIRNFRNLKKFDWKPNKGKNIILGPNGSGKSTLAIALNYLLNPYIQWYNKTLSEMDYYDRNVNNQVLIEVWFKGVDNFIDDDGELFLEHVDENDIISEKGKELVLITRFKADSDRKVSHSIFTNGKEIPFRQSHKGIINYKYIEANRDPLKELSFVSNSTLSKIIQGEELSDLMQNIIDEFNNTSSASLLSNNYFKSTLNKLGSNFAEFNLIANDEFAIGIEATELTERKTLQAFSLVCKDKVTSNYIPLKYQSRGIKNLMLLLVLQETLKDNGILFLEEPEQNLEPFMQRKIIKKLSSENNGQVFFTTHSIEVAKLYDFNNIFLMRNGRIKSLPQAKEVDDKFESRIEKFAKRELLSGLFSKGILLVEGDSELSGFPLFSQAIPNGLEDSGVEIIKGDGKDGVYKYALFYNMCDIPCISLVDNDTDIDGLLNKFKKKDIKCLVLNQPKDYECSLISMQIFQQFWKELFEEIYPFSRYKDNYLKPFVSKYSKSDVLKRKYEKNEDSIRKVKALSELIEFLDEDEIKDYQKEFLHINLAGIVNSKYVASYLIEKALDTQVSDFLPVSFMNIFRIISAYMKNNVVCQAIDRCIVNKVIDESFECECMCEKCASLKSGYTNVLQIKGE